jgi:hypothetical protein
MTYWLSWRSVLDTVDISFGSMTSKSIAKLLLESNLEFSEP